MSAGPTDEQWYKMVDCGLSRPTDLTKDQLAEGDWVYYRPWGLMMCSPGMHTLARATLLAFHLGHRNYIELANSRDMKGYHSMSDLSEAFLIEIPGTAFRSSVARGKIYAGKRQNLDAREKLVFRGTGMTMQFLEDDI